MKLKNWVIMEAAATNIYFKTQTFTRRTWRCWRKTNPSLNGWWWLNIDKHNRKRLEDTNHGYPLLTIWDIYPSICNQFLHAKSIPPYPVANHWPHFGQQTCTGRELCGTGRAWCRLSSLIQEVPFSGFWCINPTDMIQAREKNGKTGELGQDRLEVRWEAVMFLFNVVNLNVWLFLSVNLAKCFVGVVWLMFGLDEGRVCWGCCGFYCMR